MDSLADPSRHTCFHSLELFVCACTPNFGSGSSILLRCIWDFAVSGHGTLAPIDPPLHLVISGLYRYVRNPMYLGVLLVVISEAWLFRSGALLVQAGVAFIVVHGFVLLYEEPHLQRQFGSSYADYCQSVNRWLPRRPKD